MVNLSFCVIISSYIVNPGFDIYVIFMVLIPDVLNDCVFLYSDLVRLRDNTWDEYE